ncbi:MAG: ABC transporter permease [Elusimicrobiales bacterium]
MTEGGYIVFAAALLAQAIRISVPYALAAAGAAVSETAGVVNIALEGIMLTGAFCATLGTYYTGNPWIGALCAAAGGIAVSLIHAFVSIHCRANQIISGLAVNMLAVGATKFFLKLIFNSSANSARIAGLPQCGAGVLGKIPALGTLLADPLMLAAPLLMYAAWHLVYRTPLGLRMRAVGEHPECAGTLGVNVYLTRYLAVLFCGVLAAMAGAWLAFDQHQFSDGMSGGRGYIALAAMIFGKWNPLGAACAAAFFGLAETAQINLQTAGVHIPAQFIQMIPYVLTIAVLAGVIGRTRPPAADGKPYPEDEHD